MTGCKSLALVLLFCLFLHITQSAPWSSSVVQGRNIRAPFKNTELMTARGFGKRADFTKPSTKVIKDNTDDGDEDDVIPAEWLAKEVHGNPILARLMVNRFIDTNKDGLISSRELMGNSLDVLNNELF